MTRTISSLHYNRPDHSRQALDALARTVGLAGWDVHVFIDACAEGGVTSSIQKLAAAYSFVKSVTVFERHVGVYDIPMMVLHKVFDQLGSDLHIYTEDDTLVGPDGLHFVSCCEPFMDERFGTVTLHGHPVLHMDSVSPEVSASVGFTSNWIYATTPRFFQKHIVPSMGFSQKKGYDWSLNTYMSHHGLYQIRSEVRRSKSIGFIGGSHAEAITTPDLKDRWTGGSIQPPWHYDFRPLVELRNR